MIWLGLIDDQIVGPTNVNDDVKMNAETYVQFLKKNFLLWYKSQP